MYSNLLIINNNDSFFNTTDQYIVKSRVMIEMFINEEYDKKTKNCLIDLKNRYRFPELEM